MRRCALILAGLALASPALAKAPATPASAEARAAATFDRLVASPPQLRVFLQAMPKGGDLHNHMGGSIYAEDVIAWADADNLCIDTGSNHIVAPPCDAPNRVPAKDLAARDYPRYSRVIDTLSTRGFEQGINDPQTPGFDRFFSTFDSTGPATRGKTAQTIAITREQAGYDHVSYVELITLPHAFVDLLAPVNAKPIDPHDFDALYASIAAALPGAVRHARSDFDGFEAEADRINRCASAKPGAGCGVETRYQVSAIRNMTPQNVFASLALGFALADADPRFIGVNIVAPEHEFVPVRDYDLHMRMFAWLRARHPNVKLSLHAGELTLGLVPPRDLRSHIAEAIEVGGANRIGHGIDISYETDAKALLARMAKDRIAVEINLTSNAVILGVKGKDHPLALYRQAGVPVVLSTDDEGVSRSDMTNEYMRAVSEQGMRYRDLKLMARNSLEYAFLPGPSLWASAVGGAKVAACAAPGAACDRFLAGSAKAAHQMKLERELDRFEHGVAP